MNLLRKPVLYPELEALISTLQDGFEEIPTARKALLARLTNYLQAKLDHQTPIRLNFICTHNSRRSHISQIWAATAAYYYGFNNIQTYSGGTEATAFNPRAVAAMRRAGLEIVEGEGENPRYLVRFAPSAPALTCFSKTYDDPFNPSTDFAAIMTCSQAEENCPFIPGVSFRLALTYDDPKISDGTAQETATYDERVRQIGTEIFYAFSQLTNSNL